MLDRELPRSTPGLLDVVPEIAVLASFLFFHRQLASTPKALTSCINYADGFLCGCSVGVEFFARLLARFRCWQRQIQTAFENFYVRFVLAHTAH